MMNSKIIFFGILIFFVSACQDSPPESKTDTPIPVVANEPEIVDDNVTEANEYIIKRGEFFGLLIGQDIADNMGELKKGKLKNGEGNFEVHYIMTEDGKELGYLMANPKNKKKVGMIVITSPMAETEQGMKVGDPYSKLKQVVAAIEVHGSEIESRTTASAYGISYLLDVAFNTYKVDESKIKMNTRIKQITIQ